MKVVIFLLLAALLALLFFRIILHRPKKPKTDIAAVYTCDICGDRDCICHREDDRSNSAS